MPVAATYRATNFIGTWFEAESTTIFNIGEANTKWSSLNFVGCTFSTDNATFPILNLGYLSGLCHITDCCMMLGDGDIPFSYPVDTSARVYVSHLRMIKADGTIEDYNHLYEAHGNYVGSGDGTTTRFTVTHNLGIAPSLVTVTPTSLAGKGPMWVENRTATTFDIVWDVAPPANTNNIGMDWYAKV